MKFNANINGAQTTEVYVKQVLISVNKDDTVSINTANAFSIGSLVSIAQAAGDKSLKIEINGAQASDSFVKQIVAAISDKASVSVNTANAYAPSAAVSIVQQAGTKNLSLAFNGAQTSDSTLRQVLAALGSNSSVSVNTAHVYSGDTLSSLVQAAGAKKFSLEFNGAQASDSQIKQALSLAGADVTISVNTANAYTLATLLSMVQAAGNKKLSLTFNGAQASDSDIRQVLAAAGPNVSVSVNTAQGYTTDRLVSMTQAAGAKSFSLELNGAQLEADKVIQVLAVAGPKVSVSINTAHALTPANLNNIARQAGGKNLSMTFNGAQASSNTLKGAMQNGGVSGTFSLDAAQAYQAPVLQDLFATTSQVILFPLWNSAGNNSGRTSGVGSFVLKAGETLPVWEAKTVGGYKLVFQGDGNLVIYGAGDSVKWAAYSQGQGADTAVMQGDGNFVIYANGRAVWNAGTFNNPNAYLLFQENGELSVIRQ